MDNGVAKENFAPILQEAEKPLQAEKERVHSYHKCTFCRIGTRHLLNILDRITRGEGRVEDLDLLETLSEDIKNGSLCGLGKTTF